MNRIISTLFVFIVGCGPGDSALPIVSSTQIPGTSLLVHLGGPNSNGQFGYYITSKDGVHYGYRPLGRLQPNQTTPTALEKLGDGIYRINWGSAQTQSFAIIDVGKAQFVEDSNPKNPRNQPFSAH
jgi:hypothetical protein